MSNNKRTARRRRRAHSHATLRHQHRNARFVIHANDKFSSQRAHAIDNAGHVTIYTLERDEMLTREAWRHGSIIFMDRPLHEVVSELNRYNEKQIKIVDASIADVRFSGQLALRGTDRFLVVLAKSQGILSREVTGRENVIELRRGDDAP